MNNALNSFVIACRKALKSAPGPAGREQVRLHLQELLLDQSFIDDCFNDQTPGRLLLHEDSELGFCVLAHNNRGARSSAPHDHGPSWAIYGQAQGETEMTEWELVAPATSEQPGKVRHRSRYTLQPGMAQVYNEGDLHSPSRAAATRLIRIEGTNLERIKRLKYEAV